MTMTLPSVCLSSIVVLYCRNFSCTNQNENLVIVFFPSKTFPATQEIVETSKAEPGFVEIGYISSVHGLEGEVRVKSSTDFPELRFSKVIQLSCN